MPQDNKLLNKNITTLQIHHYTNPRSILSYSASEVLHFSDEGSEYNQILPVDDVWRNKYHNRKLVDLAETVFS